MGDYILLDQCIEQRYTVVLLCLSLSSRSWGVTLGNKAIREPWNQFLWLHHDSVCSALALTICGLGEACRPDHQESMTLRLSKQTH